MAYPASPGSPARASVLTLMLALGLGACMTRYVRAPVAPHADQVVVAVFATGSLKTPVQDNQAHTSDFESWAGLTLLKADPEHVAVIDPDHLSDVDGIPGPDPKLGSPVSMQQ